MGRKAQALLELALFVGIMLMVLLAALSYQRNLREQRLTDKNVFKEAKDSAYFHTFTDKDIFGHTFQCSGGIISYSLNADRQANRIFQGGQRRTTASSASIYYSNAEDPPDLQYNYYNTTDISSGEIAKKIYLPRNGGTEEPEDGLKLSTWDYIVLLYPIVSSMVIGVFSLKTASWFTSWGSILNWAIRAACYAYLAVKVAEAIAELSKSEAERAALKADDEKYGEWGWRVCDEVHDGKANAGVKYVKDVTLQVYDIETEENKSTDYGETQNTNSSTRTVNIGHQVKRKIKRRYDVTSPDPTIPLASHSFETKEDKDVTVDLSGGQSESWSW